MRRAKFTEGQETAALLVAQNELTQQQIADTVGVARNTICNWLNNETFKDRVQWHLEAIRERVCSEGIAVLGNRVAALQDRWKRLQRVMKERGADPKMANVPGGTTGLLVHNVKTVGAGMAAERVDLYELDAAMLKEMREHEKQAAQELGQWAEKHEHTGKGGGDIKIAGDLSKLSVAELESYLALMTKAHEKKDDAPAGSS